MTENMKKLLELVSANEELTKKLAGATKEELIAAAKDLNIILVDADFDQINELDDDELDAVAGGDRCTCYFGGGGSSGGVSKTCACVAGGYGEMSGGEKRCECFLAGTGEDGAIRTLFD